MLKLILVLLYFITLTIAQNCNDFINYYGDYAIIALKVPKISEHDIRVKINYKSVPRGSNGDLRLETSAEQAVSDIKANNPLKYRVQFAFPYPTAQILSIYHNNNRVCEENLGNYHALVTFSHSLNTGITLSGSYPIPFDYRPYPSRVPIVEVPQYSRPSFQYSPYYPQPQTYRPYYTTTRATVRTTTRGTTTTVRPTTRPTTTIAQRVSNSQSSFTCGERFKGVKGSSLIIGGSRAGQFDFPWLVAQFHRTRGFLCGGSLVSHKIVVTSAHCIHDKYQTRISEYDSTYYMGKYKLTSIDEGSVVTSGVEDFYTHDDWNPHDDRYVADIGIAVLTKSIRFDKYIQPVCIWDKEQSYNDFVGEEGLVAGWGITKSGKKSDYPLVIKIPVVENEECAASNEALENIISSKSFCAGKRGETPCQGDSGGGFLFRRGSKFYLRGIVSAGVTVDYECSDNDYALFTDVAQFTSWINNFISTFG